MIYGKFEDVLFGLPGWCHCCIILETEKKFHCEVGARYIIKFEMDKCKQTIQMNLLRWQRNWMKGSILMLLWMNYLLGTMQSAHWIPLKGQSGRSEFYMVGINAIKFVSCTIDYILWSYHQIIQILPFPQVRKNFKAYYKLIWKGCQNAFICRLWLVTMVKG